MDTQHEQRTLFLEEFIKRLIIKSHLRGPLIRKEEVLLEKLDNITAKPPVLGIARKPEEKKTPAPIVAAMPAATPAATTEPARSIMEPIAPIAAIKAAQQAAPIAQPRLPVMERLKPILADPAVLSISCPGPNQNIQIIRGGMTQTIQISFTMNEINDFIKDVSERTKIPLMPGLFKVIFQNLIITAVISEFIGTKFMIEKRPMQINVPAVAVRAQFK